ncbi:hypothetical protein EGW08_014084, partial [Elysia chlorotica]
SWEGTNRTHGSSKLHANQYRIDSVVLLKPQSIQLLHQLGHSPFMYQHPQRFKASSNDWQGRPVERWPRSRQAMPPSQTDISWPQRTGWVPLPWQHTDREPIIFSSSARSKTSVKPLGEKNLHSAICCR